MAFLGSLLSPVALLLGVRCSSFCDVPPTRSACRTAPVRDLDVAGKGKAMR
jgi:hypothetical protein